MRGVSIPALTAVPLILMSATQSWSQPICRPTLAFTDAHYAPMKLPRLERTWTVAFIVDASHISEIVDKLSRTVDAVLRDAIKKAA